MVQGGGDGQNWLCQVSDNGPVVSAEIAYSSTAAVQGTPYMILAVSGTAGDLYEWELVQHTEYQGISVPSMTPSHVDATSWPIVDDAMKESFNHGPPQPKEEKGVLSKIISGLAENIPKIISSVGQKMGGLPALITGLTNLIPMTGGNPMIANQGFSYPMLMAEKERMKLGLGRGSNLVSTPYEQFMREFAQLMVVNGITPEMIITGFSNNPISIEEGQRKMHYSSRLHLLEGSDDDPRHHDDRSKFVITKAPLLRKMSADSSKS
jgi:hypothetical protein